VVIKLAVARAGKTSILEIMRLIRCSGLETVSIDPRRRAVMFVGDTA
jgi:hypothetical protein